MGTLRRPPPAHRWWVAARGWLVDEIRLAGARRVATVAVGLVVATVVVWWLLRPAPEPVEARLPFAAPVTGAPATVDTDGAAVSQGATTGARVSATTLVVHVVGEVRRPGLVELPAGARVADAVAGAGGATDAAQIHAVNLAALVRDGQRVHIPHRDEADVGAQPVGGAGETASTASGFPIDVNQASADQLTTLPGIGPATAAAIVAHRERHGPFTSLDGLLEVTGIGPAKLEGLRDLATV